MQKISNYAERSQPPAGARVYRASEKMIISKDKTQIINDQYVSAIYIAGEGTTIRCEMSNGKPWNIGKYNSHKEAEIAINILTERMKKDNFVVVPSDEEVKTKINSNVCDYQRHHITGKKTKGHGGS